VRPGYTLLEVLIVMAVAVVLAAAATPSLSALVQRHRLVAVGRNLGADLAAARHEAARRSVPVYLVSHAGLTGWCWALALHAQADCHGQPETDRSLLKAVHGSDHPGVQLLVAAPLAIDPRAAPSAEKQGLSRLGNGAGEQLLVQLSPMGRAVLCSSGPALPGVPACPPEAAPAGS
jgi:prepilin-type N-terminal cleavage/methylation domain-containing protein